jgi:hypothetical protein
VVGSSSDYKGLQGQAGVLERLVEACSQTKSGSTERKAIWINLYNLAALHQVLRHYSIESPQTVPGFFSESFILFEGKRISLNHLEKQL